MHRGERDLEREASRAAVRRRVAWMQLATFAVGATVGLTTPARSETYLGAAACATGPCHGAIVGRPGARIRQDEYHVWVESDAHSRAYATLADRAAREMAQRLGLASAQTARECVVCHAPPRESVGPKYEAADGVSCEACHGASGGWIDGHDDPSTTRAQNVAAGMVALEDPGERAKVCTPCHEGAGDGGVTHELMAAGHPRLSFELDTFTYLQPAHFEVDDDYVARKSGFRDSATTWAVGQAESVRAFASVLTGKRAGRSDVWPEFSLFDCFGCHHDIGTLSASTPRDARSTLGLPKLAAPSLIFYREIVAVLDPGALAPLEQDLAAVHDAAGRNRARLAGASSRLAERAAADARRFARSTLETAAVESLLARLTSKELAARYRTYADAEEATMAVQALVATLAERKAAGDAVNRALDALFAATSKPDTFRADRFADALARMRGAL